MELSFAAIKLFNLGIMSPMSYLLASGNVCYMYFCLVLSLGNAIGADHYGFSF